MLIFIYNLEVKIKCGYSLYGIFMYSDENAMNRNFSFMTKVFEGYDPIVWS